MSKHPYLLQEEEKARQREASAPGATCWKKAEGFKSTRIGYYKMAPEPEAIAYAGPLNLVLLPALGIATLVMGVFTVPYDLLALPFRCLRHRGNVETTNKLTERST